MNYDSQLLKFKDGGKPYSAVMQSWIQNPCKLSCEMNDKGVCKRLKHIIHRIRFLP